jgi:hypothetical protein
VRGPRLRRALAALAAVALVAAAIAGLAVILLGGAISARAPDPFIPNGDPCCGHPDTWGEVASGVGWTLGYVVLDGVLIAGAVALFRWSASGTWPRGRRLLTIPLGGFLAGVVVFAAVLVPQLDEGRDLPDCDDFVFREADWRSRDDDRRLATAWGIAECGVVKDSDRRTVERKLGKPSTEGPLGDRYYLSYDGLDLIFDGGRVVEADAGYSGG